MNSVVEGDSSKIVVREVTPTCVLDTGIGHANRDEDKFGDI